MIKKLFLSAFCLLGTSFAFANPGDVTVINTISPQNGAFQYVVRSTNVFVSTTPFSKNLGSSDVNLQHALQTLDQLSTTGGGGASVNVSPHSVLFSTGGTTISGNTGLQYDDSVSSVTLGGSIGVGGIGNFTGKIITDANNELGSTGLGSITAQSLTPYIVVWSTAPNGGGLNSSGLELRANGPSGVFTGNFSIQTSGSNLQGILSAASEQILMQGGNGFNFLGGSPLEMNFGATFGVGPRFISDGVTGNFYSPWVFNDSVTINAGFLDNTGSRGALGQVPTSNGTSGGFTWQTPSAGGSGSPGLPNLSLQTNQGNFFVGTGTLTLNTTEATFCLLEPRLNSTEAFLSEHHQYLQLQRCFKTN